MLTPMSARLEWSKTVVIVAWIRSNFGMMVLSRMSRAMVLFIESQMVSVLEIGMIEEQSEFGGVGTDSIPLIKIIASRLARTRLGRT